MKRLGSLVPILVLALPLLAQTAAPISDGELSRRITASAEKLLAAEKEAAKAWKAAAQAAAPETDAGEGVDRRMYEDVLGMLDSALDVDPKNYHARAVAADVLLLKAYEGEGTWDVCCLLDARADAAYVITHASRVPAGDLATARRVIQQIESIPKDEIPDPPSSCDDDEHRGPTTTASRAHA
jgi:hypothetical protein